MVAQRFNYFAVGKFQQSRPLLDDDDAHAESRKHAGVLDADDAAAHDDEGLGYRGDAEHLIAVDDVPSIGRDLGIHRGLGARGDDHVPGFQFVEAARVFDPDMAFAGEDAQAVVQLHTVALQLVLENGGLIFDHPRDPEIQVLHGDVVFYVVIGAVKRLVVETRKVQHSLAHCLARNGTGVDADASNDTLLFNHRHPFSGLGRLDCGSLPTRPRADDHQIILLHVRIPV